MIGLLTLKFKYPELDLQSIVLTSEPPIYQTKLVINNRVLWKVENKTNFQLNYEQLMLKVLEFGITTLIQQSKQP